MDLTIIILNWNTAPDLRNCLRSIEENAAGYSFETVVADNCSQDDSVEMTRREFPGARLIRHPGNLGYGAGNNEAARQTDSRYILFLNSDTLLTPGALDGLLAFADRNPQAGIIGPKLLNQDGSLQYSCRHFPNLGAGFFRNTPLGRLFPNNRYNQNYLMTNFDHETIRDVDWVSGAAFLIRREAFDAVSGFDTDFYMYCEDVDLCWRVHEAGYQVLYLPDVQIYHIIGRSSDKVPARMTYHFHLSMYRFYQKHYRKQTPFFIRPLIIPGLILRAVGKIARYRWTGIMRSRHKR